MSPWHCICRMESTNDDEYDDEAPLKSCPALTFQTGEKCVPPFDSPFSTASMHTPQMFRHTLLLMLSCCSMCSSLSISMTRMTGMWDTSISFPGVYKVRLARNTEWWWSSWSCCRSWSSWTHSLPLAMACYSLECLPWTAGLSFYHLARWLGGWWRLLRGRGGTCQLGDCLGRRQVILIILRCNYDSLYISL